MDELKTRFTDLQIKNLRSSGFVSIYDILTYLPIKLNKIEPISENIYPKTGVKYLFDSKLVNVVQRPGKKKFLVLEWDSWPFKTYLFSITKFTLSSLKSGQTYQSLLTFKEGFWNLHKYTIKKSNLHSDYFVLGEAHHKFYLEPQYERLKDLSNLSFLKIHQKLKPSDYLLNLSGLIPENDTISQTLDLSGIHRPNSLESYEVSKNQWVALKTFLRMSLVRYIDIKRQVSLVQSGPLDMEFLKKSSIQLPFELTISQKQIIWSILQEITNV